jgi:hypothetical protein
MRACLGEAGLSLDRIDHIVLPIEPTKLTESCARFVLRVPSDKIVSVVESAHVGFGDPILGLESLLGHGEALFGRSVLVFAKTVGIVRCAALRWRRTGEA